MEPTLEDAFVAGFTVCLKDYVGESEWAQREAQQAFAKWIGADQKSSGPRSDPYDKLGPR